MTTASEVFNDAQWFRRFRLPADDLAETSATVERDTVAVSSGSLTREELLDTLLGLTWALTPLGRESEAVTFGEQALHLAQDLDSRNLEVEALLHLATAHQYCGADAIAEALFYEGLELARAADHPQLHFLLHHRGRLHAEASELEAARACFEEALLLRQVVGNDTLIASTENALATLEEWCASR
jgi:HTH-type transcriptional regulator, pleiotropic regulator of extracellular virulence genes